MLPWLRNCHAIVAESWTISSIVLNATRLLARYAQGYSRCKVELLADYYDGSAEAEATTEIALERVVVGTSGVVLVAFSACMTGNAVSGLRGIVDRYCHGELSARFGSLYNLQPGLDIECLCELFRELPPDSFRHYAQRPTEDILVIDIDRTTYFPSVITEVEIGVDRACAKPAEEFFQRYGTAKVFFIRRNSYVAGQKVRHHAIYTDTEALLAHPVFTSKLSQQLGNLEGKPSLIITPPHDPGRALARFAERVLRERDGSDVRVWEHLDLSFPQEPSPSEAELLGPLAQAR